MKLNRTLVLCLSIVLAASMALGGTLAFLTDTETKVNEFTVGDVDIELKEEFEQGSQLMPGEMVHKAVWIENVGSNPAWVWYTWAVPANLENFFEFQFANVIDEDEDGLWGIYEGVFDDDDNTTKAYVTIDGVDYVMYAALHHEPLQPGASTESNLEKVILKANVDYNPVTGTYHLIENGVPSEGVPAADLQNLKIIVTAYAFQTEGFEDKTIYDVVENYKGQWGSLESVVGETKDAVSVSEVYDQDTLFEAVRKGGKIKLVGTIGLDEQLRIEADQIVNIDLNGFQLHTADMEEPVHVKGNLTIGTTNGGEMHICGGSVGINTSVDVEHDNPVVAIKGGDYYFGGGNMFTCTNGVVTIYNGNFTGHGGGFIGNAPEESNGLIVVYGANCNDVEADFVGNYIDKRN